MTENPNYLPPPPPPPPARPYQVGDIPLAPLTLGNLFSGSWRNWTRNAGAVLGWPLILSSVGSLLFSFAIIYGIYRTVDLAIAADTSSTAASTDLVPEWLNNIVQEFTLWTSIGMIPLVILFILAQAVTMIPSARGAVGLKTTFTQNWRIFAPRIGNVLIFGIALAIITILLAVGTINLFWVSMQNLAITFDATDPESNDFTELILAVVFGGLGLFFLVFLIGLGLMFLLVRFIFVIPVMVVEKVGPLTAMKRSWQLVRGRYWPVLGTYLLMSLIVSTVSQIVVGTLSTIFSTMEFGMTAFTGPDFISSPMVIGVTVFSTVVQIVLAAAINIYLYLVINNMYLDLRFRHENLHQELIQRSEQDASLISARNGDPAAVEATATYLPSEL